MSDYVVCLGAQHMVDHVTVLYSLQMLPQKFHEAVS